MAQDCTRTCFNNNVSLQAQPWLANVSNTLCCLGLKSHEFDCMHSSMSVVYSCSSGIALLEGQVKTWAMQWDHSFTLQFISTFLLFTANQMIVKQNFKRAAETCMNSYLGLGSYWKFGIGRPIPKCGHNHECRDNAFFFFNQSKMWILLTSVCLFHMQEVVTVQGDHERLLHIQRVIKELPTPHFRWTSAFFSLSSTKTIIQLTVPFYE